MSEKMGTHYVREIVQNFRDVATTCNFPEVKGKLLSLADELEPLATKLYFKTQKGTTDMEKMAADLANFKSDLGACKDEAAANSLCEPFFNELDAVITHVKNMKVRMT